MNEAYFCSMFQHYPYTEETDIRLMKLWQIHGTNLDCNWKNEEGETLLHWASDRGFTNFACLLLSLPDIQPNAENSRGIIPLEIAGTELTNVMLENHRVCLTRSVLEANKNFISPFTEILKSERLIPHEWAQYEITSRTCERAVEFQKDPKKTRKELRKRLNNADPSPIQIFLFALLYVDGYYTLIKNPPENWQRFLAIFQHLPLELQMMLCNNQRLIPTKDINRLLKFIIVDGWL